MNIYVREDYKTMTEALAAASDGDTLYIPSGIYREKIYVKNKNITFIGQGDVTLVYNAGAGNLDENGIMYDTFTSATVTVCEGADGFRAENITFENNYNREDIDIKVTQGLAISCGADAVFENCRFLGKQDTVYVWGRTTQYYTDCYIEGSVDFIFGDASALFENCHINCVREKSYISAASTEKDRDYGLVFYKCNITANHNCDNIYMGRPWRAELPGIQSHTAFIECIYDFDGNPEAWLIWHAPPGHEREKIRYEEYGNVKPDGSAIDVSGRIDWSYQISREQAERIVRLAKDSSDELMKSIKKEWD